jgi:hypothetical protein
MHFLPYLWKNYDTGTGASLRSCRILVKVYDGGALAVNGQNKLKFHNTRMEMLP